MKTIPALISTAAIALTLTACSPGIHGFGHSLTFQNDELVARAPQQPNAYISPDGDLRIGKREIAVTPGQQKMLKDYYDESRAVTAAGEATGKAGVELAMRAIGNSIKDLFTDKSAAEQRDLNAQANAIKASALGMCNELNRLHGIQQAIAAQLPAFKPYDATGGTGCDLSAMTHPSGSAGPSGSAAAGKSTATAH